ncbi:MAG: AmmeMemoRadiSam system radical SAM enzyme [Magnetococcales bacterium]|nr:AmmeMemoRadiSam system radical SAM enzyme [Magnetococcales bacterium]NGZ26277.1 AmmeMemoRadiSam system radical SAM enzyme [Magnetococcales bacterium]
MNQVICDLCPHYCTIPPGGAGDCRVRVNLGGRLVASTFGRPSAVHVDPVEKKPLFHFLPGSTIFSLATAGCNLHCRFCQNWQLSQRDGTQMEQVFHAPPQQIIHYTLQEKCPSIAYTYSEPIVFYEYVLETSTLAREKGLKNVLVTAGYINEKPLRQLCRVMDATNTDLKAFDEGFYRDICGASLKPVLQALTIFRQEGVWLEITYLVVPTLNDDLVRIRAMCKWILSELGAEVPLHFSRFHPMYRLQNLPPTPEETLIKCRQVAKDVGLHHVYIGNISGQQGENTFCPQDGTLLIRRFGHAVQENRLKQGRCPTCDHLLAGVW